MRATLRGWGRAREFAYAEGNRRYFITGGIL